MRRIAVLSAALVVSLALAATAPASAQVADGRGTRLWTQVEGTIVNIQGNQLTLKMEGDHRLSVDLSPMSPLERTSLATGQRTTLIGYSSGQRGHFVAWFLPVQASPAETSGMASPRMAPSSYTPPSQLPAWVIAHGRVDRIDASRLVLITDDGRTVTADMAGVEPAMRSAIARDEGVTVIGFYTGDPDVVAARYIHRDAEEVAGQAPAGVGR